LSSNICFVGNTLVTTDQGDVYINSLIPGTHTIAGQHIAGITKTHYLEDSLVLFKRHALQINVPNRDTYTSMEHHIHHEKEVRSAHTFVNSHGPFVVFVPYQGDILYNVILEGQDHRMMVHNMQVETLHPSNVIAKLFTNPSIAPIRDDIIFQLNESVARSDPDLYDSICRQIRGFEPDLSRPLSQKNPKSHRLKQLSF